MLGPGGSPTEDEGCLNRDVEVSGMEISVEHNSRQGWGGARNYSSWRRGVRSGGAHIWVGEAGGLSDDGQRPVGVVVVGGESGAIESGGEVGRVVVANEVACIYSSNI